MLGWHNNESGRRTLDRRGKLKLETFMQMIQEAYAFQFYCLQLEAYMDEGFLQSSLEQMGEHNVVSIKVMKNKFTGEPASYGFINFDNDNHALTAMHKLNGKVIPNTNPVS